MSGSILTSAATLASYNMLLQLLFRVLTFGLNAFVLRHVSRDMLGVVNVRLMLLYSTTLFVSREAFRRACLSRSTDRRWQQVVNLLWCTVPLGIICAAFLGVIWIYVLEPPDTTVVPYYDEGVLMFALSTVIEMLAEPLWVIGQVLLFVRLRVIIEGVALGSRCLLTVLLIIIYPDWGLFAFSLAQVIFTVIYTTLYYAYFFYYLRSGNVEKDFPFHSMRDVLPKVEAGKSVFSPGLTSLTWSFLKQSVLKQFLTEGERYVMTVFNVLSFADQGIYDVINNLGSLAARFIFLPLEDAAYLLFSHTLERGVPLRLQSKDHQELSSCVLECLLKFVVLVGMTILIFGISNAELALDLYGGSILSSGSGPNLLRWYCFYVLLIAMNGVTESFVFASMSKQEVDKYNQKMLVFSALFLVSSWYLTGYVGSLGFILANCLNMGARISHSINYIIKYYEETPERPLWGLLPYRPVLMAYGSAFATTFTSMRLFCCSRGLTYRLAHIAISAGSLAVVLLVIYFTEQPLINFFKEQYDKHRAKTQTDHKARVQAEEKPTIKQD